MRLRPRKEPFRYSLGQRGETAACAYLVSRGYKILEQNYRCPIGELDLVAQKGKSLRFVEVKTRTSRHYGRPEESVTLAKQKKLVKVAQWYIKDQKMSDPSMGFDVVAIEWETEGNPEIRLIENAFTVQ